LKHIEYYKLTYPISYIYHCLRLRSTKTKMASGLTLHTVCRGHEIMIYGIQFIHNIEFKGTITGPLYNADIHFCSSPHLEQVIDGNEFIGYFLSTDQEHKYMMIYMLERFDEATGSQCWDANVMLPSVINPGFLNEADRCIFTHWYDEVKGVHDG